MNLILHVKDLLITNNDYRMLSRNIIEPEIKSVYYISHNRSSYQLPSCEKM